MLLFNAPATTEIYTLSLHDALPISGKEAQEIFAAEQGETPTLKEVAESDIYLDIGDKDPQNFESIIEATEKDRKSTRLNSSHVAISYAVFCLKKKNKPTTNSKDQKS